MPQIGKGFNCLSEVKGLIYYPVKANVNITEGDALQDDGDGDAQLAVAGLTSTEFLGVAAGDADNSSNADGDIDVAIIPPRADYRFYVAVGTGTIIDTDRGAILELKDKNSLNRDAGVVTSGYGFWVDEIDSTNVYAYGFWRLAG